MVEISTEQSMLIAVITFLSTFFLLIGLIPGTIMIGQEGRTVVVPEYFESVDILYIINSKDFVLSGTFSSGFFDLGGYRFTTYMETNHEITLEHWWFDWIIIERAHSLEWVDSTGYLVSYNIGPIGQYEVIDIDALDEPGTNSELFTCKCSHTSVRAGFYYNQTSYDSFSSALDAGDLHLWIGIEYDKANTSMNAWNLIGAILFFQMPSLHPAINALIAIPVWVAIAYLIYILILKAIPFVGG